MPLRSGKHMEYEMETSRNDHFLFLFEPPPCVCEANESPLCFISILDIFHCYLPSVQCLIQREQCHRTQMTTTTT